jgi:hypothetical protein
VEDVGWEVDLEVVGHEESSDGGQDDSEEEDNDEEEGNEDGHEEGVGLNDEGMGVTGLLQDLHPHTILGGAASFTLL